MFSLVRTGPKILLVEATDIAEIKSYLKEDFNAEESPLNSALENSGEDYLIIFLVKEIKEVVSARDIEDAFIIKNLQEEFLCRVINDGRSHLIKSVRTAPRIILMRAMGDIERIVEDINRDYKGSVGEFEGLLDNTNDKGTIIAFVEKSLNKNIQLNDIYKKSIFVPESYFPLLRSLRMHGLKYLNEGLGNKDWSELEIRIYDTFSAYSLHYGRLLKVIEELELGIILGESWGKDSPRFLMTIGIYRLRFFTVYPPKYIKKILVGLEHLEDGMRIVDFDLYFNRKKIDWTDVMEKDCRVRKDLSKRYRDEILSKLESDEIKKILSLEEEIILSRQ